jgi:hypothetical protein
VRARARGDEKCARSRRHDRENYAVLISQPRGVRVALLEGKEKVMANQKNQGGRQQPKQGKNPAEQQKRDPMRSPEGGEDIERDRSSSRNRDDKGVESGVISNDEEVEVDVSDLEDEESDQITGRHPSQRDRDLK